MLKLGIVGLPNVGKSSLFNALTAAGAAAENYPFCTVEPNVGMVEVPDDRLHRLADIVQPKKVVPAVVQFVDIAGLVKGAAEGEGLGNKFLSNIRETDAIVQVVRCFEDPDVIHVMGAVDPVRDREVIEFELALADLSVVEKRLDRTQRAAKTGDKDAKSELDHLTKALAFLREGKGLWEARAGTIHNGDTAPAAAGVIHTDFERGFIRAETVAYPDFIANGGWKGARGKGVARAEGKEYVVADGDVLLFRFNV